MQKNKKMEIEEKLEELQNDLSLVDMLSNNRRCQSSSGMMELLVMKMQNIKIKIYQEKGHATPHLHIDYGKENHTASYSILDSQRLVGNLNRKYDKKVQDWVTKNQNLLFSLWNDIQKGIQTDRIIAEIQGNA